MEKLIFTQLFLLLLMRPASGNAQILLDHEIQLGYGALARPQVIDDAITTFIGSLFLSPLPKLDFSNAYALTYRYQARRRMAIGLTTAFTTGSKFDTYYNISDRYYKKNNLIVAFELKFSYIDNPRVQLYAITGLGGLLVRSKHQFYNESRTYAWPTCQLTPFGIRYGKLIGAFAEVGFGYKGVFNAGLSARF